MIPGAFSLGPFTIHLYGLIIAVAILLGWWIVKKRSYQLGPQSEGRGPHGTVYKLNPALFDDPLLFLPLILGIIGGRLYHVIDKWGFYSQNPGLILAISNGGLGIFGALVGVFIGFWLFANAKKINFLSLLDLIAPSLILGQAIGRIGNFINQEGFGPPTNLPWGVYIDPAHRPIQYLFSTHFHPTFFYEAILEVLAFIILISFSKKLKTPGQTLGLYLILYAVARGLAELFRIDTAKVGDIKVAYLLLVPVFAAGLWLIYKKRSAILKI